MAKDAALAAAIGARVRGARIEKGLTQQDVADACGVKVPTVWRWEHGEMTPGGSHLGSLAALFGMSIEELLGRDVPADPAPSAA